MYVLNKIVGGCLNPLVVGMMLMLIACICMWLKRRRIGVGVVLAAIGWLWLWSTPMMYRWIGVALEREWSAVKAEEAPTADAIVLLGGGMGANTNVYPKAEMYSEMWSGADRVWHAARLWKAGKAPIVIPTGCGEKESSVPLLRDFGVPERAIVVEDKARNTEENAKFVERILNHVEHVDHVEGVGKNSRVERVDRVEEGDGESKLQNASQLPTANYQLPTKKKILLVTSAWHMRRSVLMYRKYAPSLEIIPAAADYEAMVITGHPFAFKDIWPDAELLSRNSYIFKEYLGYWGYRLFRR